MQSSFLFFVVRRAINAIITLILLILIVFALIHIILPTPQALARVYIGGAHVTAAQVSAAIVIYGLNKPIYIQFLNYLANIFSG
ncbi:MAG: hypothetical protein QXI38_04065, partial [Conexivisphaerales archaeon]